MPIPDNSDFGIWVSVLGSRSRREYRIIAGLENFVFTSEYRAKLCFYVRSAVTRRLMVELPGTSRADKSGRSPSEDITCPLAASLDFGAPSEPRFQVPDRAIYAVGSVPVSEMQGENIDSVVLELSEI